MAKKASALERMREICLSFPNTKETITWGEPHFRVGEKIFSGYGGGENAAKASIGFKLEMEHARDILQDSRFARAPYVGHKGWVSMDVSKVDDWEEVRALVEESYRLIAPKKLVALLDGGGVATPAKVAKKAAPKRAAKKAVAKKASGAAKSASRAKKKAR